MFTTPGAMPDTTPVGPTVATSALLLLQAPPPLPSTNVTEEPWQIAGVPEIATGCAFTVKTVVA